MMNCNEIEKYFLPFLYDSLEPLEYKNVKEHLKICKSCRKKMQRLLRLKIILQTTPQEQPDDRYEYILQKAKQIKNAHYLRILYFISMILKNFKFRIVAASTFLLLVFILLFPINNDYLFVLRVSGDVEINNNSFFQEQKLRYNLKHKIYLNTGEGEALLQINKNKVILLKKGTKLKIYSKKDININLLRGSFFGKVKHNKGKHLLIFCGEKKFKVVGTTFYISKNKNRIKLLVKDGIIESVINDKVLSVKNNEKLIITNKNLYITKNLNRTLFSQITGCQFYTEPLKLRRLTIKTSPQNADIFLGNINIGKTPMFIAIDRNFEHFTIKHKNYFPKQITLNKKENYIIDTVLAEEKYPSILWKKKLTNKVFAPSISIDEFIIVSDNSGFVYKINSETKKIVWKFKTKQRIMSAPLYFYNILYVSSTDGYIYAIDFRNGNLIWKKKIGALVYSKPLCVNKKLYLFNSRGEFFCLNSENGEILFKQKLDTGFFSSPVYKNENIYIGGFTGIIYAINLHTKKVDWTFKTKNRIVGSSGIIKSNTFFIGGNDKFLYAINVKTGKLKWKFLTNGEIFTSPLLINNSVIVASIKGTIYSLSIKSGEINWKFNTGNKILHNLYYKDGLIYIASGSHIYILNEYGILYTKFKINLTNFFVKNKKALFVFCKDSFLYKFSYNF